MSSKTIIFGVVGKNPTKEDLPGSSLPTTVVHNWKHWRFCRGLNLRSKECRFNDRAGECRVVQLTTQYFILNKAKTLPIRIDGFTVTSSDCKVKKARFYEFLFTLGWRLIGNTSLYKFPAPKHVSFRKYSNLNFRVFTVRDTKIGMLSRWKKVSPLDFQQYNHFKY